MLGAEHLLNKLLQSQVVETDPSRHLFLEALIITADRITGMGVDSRISFVSIQLFCTMVSEQLQAHVWEALKAYGCLEEPEVTKVQQA